MASALDHEAHTLSHLRLFVRHARGRDQRRQRLQVKIDSIHLKERE